MKIPDSSIEDLYQVERKYIEKHKPGSNEKKCGNGRRPKFIEFLPKYI